MKLLGKNLNKKTMVLVGAMVLSLAMGTVAYAGTANDKTEATKLTESIPATMCVEATKLAPAQFVEATELKESIPATMCVEATKLAPAQSVEVSK